ncbi:MAG: ketoacyl-ACP synthase III [Pseudomonadota bacterium]
MNMCIHSIDYYLPSNVIQTRDMVGATQPERLGFSETLIEDLIGIKEVRHAASDEKPSTLATKAAQKALAKFKGNIDDIGAVIFCGIEGDYIEPSTAHIVQSKLGLKNAVCFDVSNACLGFMTGISIAAAMLSSGSAKSILVCTGECPSRVSKAAIPQLKKLEERSLYFNSIGSLTVGDAGAAAILDCDSGSNRIEGLHFSSNGKLAELCYYTLENNRPQGQMLMTEISTAILDAHQKLLPETLKKSSLQTKDIDCLITHQVGKRPWKRHSTLFGVDLSAMTKTFDTLGNVTSATFGVNYSQALDDKSLNSGKKVVAAMAGSGLSVCQVVLTV